VGWDPAGPLLLRRNFAWGAWGGAGRALRQGPVPQAGGALPLPPPPHCRAHNIERMSSEGHPFDPSIHEAVMREQREDVADDTVVRELRAGYLHAGKLLRPALVAVSYSS